MTGYTSKRKVAQDKLDDDDIQTYQRPWVELTDEERRTVLFKSDTAEEVAIGIKAKLKDKNT